MKSLKHTPLSGGKLIVIDFLRILVILARRYLAIPATSASIKGIFSTGGNIITKLRSSLEPETIKKLILLMS